MPIFGPSICYLMCVTTPNIYNAYYSQLNRPNHTKNRAFFIFELHSRFTNTISHSVRINRIDTLLGIFCLENGIAPVLQFGTGKYLVLPLVCSSNLMVYSNDFQFIIILISCSSKQLATFRHPRT